MFIRVALYSLAYNCAQLLILPFFPLYCLYRLYKKKETAHSLREKFGFVPSAPAHKKIIWLHAVSVGEALLLRSIITTLKKSDPNIFCYVTTGTLLGKKIVQEHLEADCVSFAPLDFLFSTILAFRRIKPSAIMIAEAELWPNFLTYATLHSIPSYWINGRVKTTAHTFKRRFHQTFLVPFINLFSHAYVQTENDVTYLLSHKIPQNRVTLLGNLKIVSVAQAYKKESKKNKGRTTKFPCLLAGSIHADELDAVLYTFSKMREKYLTAQLILAPRHFTWLEELYKKLEEKKFSYQTFSSKSNEQATVIVVDTIGHLFSLYRQADLFFLGGTFVPVGGHNLLEPAAWGVPMLVGPYYHATTHIAQELQAAGALKLVVNQDDLCETALRILDDQALCTTMSIAGKEWIKQVYETSNTVVTNSLLPSLIHGNVHRQKTL